MRKPWLSAMFLAAVGVLAARPLLTAVMSRPWRRAFALDMGLTLAGLLLLVYVAWRVMQCHRGMRRFVRHLLAGNYEAGLDVPPHGRDELSDLMRLLDKLGEQLRIYDQLRAERVRTAQSELDVLAEHSPTPVLLYDAAREVFQCNRALRELFEYTQQKISLAALEKAEINRPFLELLARATKTDKGPQEGEVTLQFPAEEAQRRLRAHLFPVKDKNEAVLFVVVLADTLEAPPRPAPEQNEQEAPP